MLAKPEGCRGCPLEFLGQGFARTDGKGDLGILVVAEALGEEEAKAGLPLVGPTGLLFNRMVERVKDLGRPGAPHFRRDDFLLANVVNCHPEDNALAKTPYEVEAIQHCSPYLEETLRTFRPKAILAMGDIALRRLTGRHVVKEWRGYVIETEYGPVIPTYHPSFLGRGNFPLCEVWQHDLRTAVRVSREGVKRAPIRYAERPSPSEALAWTQDYLRDPSRLLAFDIETPYSPDVDEVELQEKSDLLYEEDDPSYTIVRISFSWEGKTAISMPWCQPYIGYARQLLGTAQKLAVWNGNFDVPRLRANGAEIPGHVYDYMLLFHMVKPHIPYGLKYVATFYTDLPQWKHQSASNPEYYSCVDADALIRVAGPIEEEARKRGQWDLFERHFVRLNDYLTLVSRRGVPLAPSRRRLARMRFSRDLRLLQEKLNALVPVAARKVKIYKTKPKAEVLAVGAWIEVEDGTLDPRELMPCGHMRRQIVSTEEGTSSCKGCEKEAKKNEAKRLRDEARAARRSSRSGGGGRKGKRGGGAEAARPQADGEGAPRGDQAS